MEYNDSNFRVGKQADPGSNKQKIDAVSLLGTSENFCPDYTMPYSAISVNIPHRLSCENLKFNR
jgi:hypothetical protein